MTNAKLAFLTQLTVLLTAPLAHASDTTTQEAAASPSLRILGASLEGSLCPQGSGVPNISGDGEAITVTFSAAEVSPNSGQTSGQCSVHLDLAVPRGYSFSGLKVASSGYYFTSGWGRANLTVGYTFPSSGAGQRFTHKRMHGDMDYVFPDVADEAWSPCGSASGEPVELDLDLDLSVSGSSYMNLSALDADVRLGSQLQWRTCQAP